MSTVLDRIETSSAMNIFENAVVVTVSLRKLGIKRGVDPKNVQIDADKDMIHVHKDILDADCEPLKKIRGIDGKIKRALDRRCLPIPLKGAKVVPTGFLEEIDAALEACKLEREFAGDQFCDIYPQLVEASKAKLKGEWKEEDYPPVEEVRRAFDMQYRYVMFSVPEKIKGISPEIFKREQEKQREQLINAANEMREALRVSLAEMVDDLVGRLQQPDENGKKKVIRPSALVDKMRDFIQTFNVRNLTNDTELAALTDKARQILDGVDPETLCKDLDIRKSVRQGFEEIKTNLNQILETKPARAISFDDEE